MTAKEMKGFARRRAQIMRMFGKGKTKSEISRHFGVSRQRVAQIIDDEMGKSVLVHPDEQASGYEGVGFI